MLNVMRMLFRHLNTHMLQFDVCCHVVVVVVVVV